MRWAGFLCLLMFVPLLSASESISDTFLLVQVEEYKLNNSKKAVESSNIIASWVIRKSEEIELPFVCSTLLGGYLDSEKTKIQNIARLRKMLSESDSSSKLFADNESAVNVLRLSRQKTEQKIKNIDQFSYSVTCLKILPNSELERYFSFSREK